jgi:hypothetical protein
MNADPSLHRKNFAVLAVLSVLTIVVTAFLFFFLSDSSSRGEPFYVTLVWALIIEALGFGYAMSFFTLFDWSAPTRFGVGTVTGIYAAIAVVSMLFFNLTGDATSIKAYYTTLIVTSVLYVIGIGAVVLLNSHRQTETQPIQKERDIVRDWLVQLEVVASSVSQNKTLSAEIKNAALRDLTLLRETLQFNPPYGITASTGSVSTEIIDQNLRELVKSVGLGEAMDSRTVSQTLSALKQHFAVAQKELVR